jgi:hypothetical protein
MHAGRNSKTRNKESDDQKMLSSNIDVFEACLGNTFTGMQPSTRSISNNAHAETHTCLRAIDPLKIRSKARNKLTRSRAVVRAAAVFQLARIRQTNGIWRPFELEG